MLKYILCCDSKYFDMLLSNVLYVTNYKKHFIHKTRINVTETYLVVPYNFDYIYLKLISFLLTSLLYPFCIYKIYF